MKNFPRSAFHALTSLQTLDLSGNDLKSAFAAGAFENLPEYLYNMRISRGGLTHVPAFQKPKQISDLFLVGNEISEIRHNDFDTVSLDNLDLDGNPISQIERGSFQRLGKIKFLHMASTMLESFDLSLLSGMNALEDVHLRNTFSLTSLTVTNPDEVPSYVEKLDLASCNLNYISPDIEKIVSRKVQGRFQYVHLDLSNNTNLVCDQNVHWMAKHAFCRAPSGHGYLIELDNTTKCNNGESLKDYLKKYAPPPKCAFPSAIYSGRPTVLRDSHHQTV